MKLKLIVITFLILESMHITCAALPHRATVVRREANTLEENSAINYTTLKTIKEMQHAFESQPTKAAKTHFIALLLAENLAEEQDAITIQEKISYIKNLRKIIKLNISLYSGWFWNAPENQDYINWLQTKLHLIDKTIKKLEWQASSFGYKTTVRTATLMSYYLAAVVLAYAAQYQYAQTHNLKMTDDLAQIAVMPITTIIHLATQANLKIMDAYKNYKTTPVITV